MGHVAIHERVRKPHFGAIDGAIARALDDGQEIMVSRVEDDALDGGLCRNLSELCFRLLPARIHLDNSHLQCLQCPRHCASASLAGNLIDGAR